ncbi:MAG TPA: hypothetical protein VKZ58_03985 [Longimicrobiales bacterium]|nr:hypothetical protein [Longimicrobiales bacterium]
MVEGRELDEGGVRPGIEGFPPPAEVRVRRELVIPAALEDEAGQVEGGAVRAAA